MRVTKKSTRNARHWQVAIPEAPWPEIPSSQRHDVPMIRWDSHPMIHPDSHPMDGYEDPYDHDMGSNIMAMI